MKYFYSFMIALLLVSCGQLNKSQQSSEESKIERLISNLEDSENDDVIVVAHRGDWRYAPENSLQAIQNCIDLGVDMVEIDVRETKDGQLVLMHDKTINRTTNGEGRVSDFSLDSLKSFYLLDMYGEQTMHKIPTLEEALLLTKDKILVNLDKSYHIFDKCFFIIEKTNTMNQVIIKGAKTRAQVEEEFGEYLSRVYFMPVINLNHPNAKNIVNDYLENLPPIAFEFIIPQDTFALIQSFKDIRTAGSGVWVNALWPSLNAGYDDEKAVLNPDIYHWYLEHHVDMIQTDRPRLLIDYLKMKNHHQ